MCGISAHTADPDGAQVRAMNGRMVHRGPDDEGVYVDREAGIALGARRLSVIDVEGGHQPVGNEDGTVWACLNGEIYNHRELQARLEAHGHTLRSRTDTEVLVHLYEDFGAEMVHALDGMFAFAIWDTRSREMIVARDRFGEKPLFYSVAGGTLVLASELTALRAGMKSDPDLDPRTIDAFYVFGYVPGPAAIVKEVQQLPPGHLLHWQQDTQQLSQRSYWQPPLFGSHSIDHMDPIAEVEAALERSLRGRMIADVPLGIFLSGGLDSALIATLAARISSRPIKTFTVGYDVGAVNETAAARDVARAIGSDHHEVILLTSELAATAPEVLSRLDQPNADQALIALHAVASTARREITVAVGGEGADELFAGYPRYRWLARGERVRAVVPERAASGAAALLTRLPVARSGRLADVMTPMSTVSRHVEWVTGGRRRSRETVYGPALRGEGAHLQPPELEVGGLVPWGLPVASGFMRLDQVRYLPDDVLQKADRATMLASLEMRTPFLDRELCELAASIPLSSHTRQGGKAILRSVLARTGVPLEHRRSKRAFRVPVADWLRGPLAGYAAELVGSSAAFSEGWFDRTNVRRLVDEHSRGSTDHSSALWPVLVFAAWIDAWRAL